MIYQKFQSAKLHRQTPQKGEGGFVIIIALITSTIILSIAIGVLSISLKDYVFSGFTTSSTKALFAADTGLDCALAFDLKNTSVPAPAPGVLDPPISFDNASYYGGFSDSFSITAIDLNGDGGGMDLAVATENNIFIFSNKNDGTGTFNTATFFSSGITSTTFRPIAAGDVNGDGKEDLVVGNYNSSSVSVFINNLSGGFLPGVSYNSGGTPRSIAIGNLNNGDNKKDIVVANYANIFTVLFNTGAGNGAPIDANTFNTRFSDTTGGLARHVVIGDLNGDSNPDLVITSSVSNTGVYVFQNMGSNGGNTIDADTFSSINSFRDFPSGTTAPYATAIEDLNGDTKPDLVVANYNATYAVSVLRNTGTVGASIDDNTFNSYSYYTAGGMARSVATGDLNGDNKKDIAVVRYGNPYSVSVLRNTGIGIGYIFDASTFSTQSYSNSGSFSSENALVMADFNDDDVDDLATVNPGSNNISVFINNGPQYTVDTCVPSTTYSGPDINCGGQTVTPTAPVTTCTCANIPPLTTPRTCTTSFSIGNSTDPSLACAEVEIVSTYDHKGTESTIGPPPDEEKTRIRSRGHNSCDLNNPRRVERALELNYGQ